MLALVTIDCLTRDDLSLSIPKNPTIKMTEATRSSIIVVPLTFIFFLKGFMNFKDIFFFIVHVSMTIPVCFDN